MIGWSRQRRGHWRSIAARSAPAIVLLAAVCGVLRGQARAQMLLPGANNGNAVGAGATSPSRPSEPAGDPTPSGLRPIVIKSPSPDTIAGRSLSRDGRTGSMMLNEAGDDLTLVKLKLEGDNISRPQDTCSVDVSITKPIAVTPAGRPAGALRFDVPIGACPFTIDVLEGAVLVSRADPSCDFVAADCRVTPGGLWGPPASEISPTQIKDLLRDRVRIETMMRTNFRALLKRAGKDRTAVKEIARDQAAFSSQREMTCRDYDQEPAHGFCSTRITQARALELLAKFGALEEPPSSPRRHMRPKIRPKPIPAAAPAAAFPSTGAAAR